MVNSLQVTHPVWPKEEPRNIIVRMPNWLGDFVMATPVLADLRTRFPKATLTAMCLSKVCPLISHDPHLDEILCFERPSGWIHRSQHYEIIAPLQKGEYDLGLLLTNSFSSAWWFWRGNVKNRIGFKNGFRDFLLNKAVPFPKNKDSQHLVLTYKALLEPIGIPISNTSTALFLHDSELVSAKFLLSKYGAIFGKHTIIGINPGAAYGSAKCWLPERFSEVVERLLSDPNTYVVFFGDSTGANLVNQICENTCDRVVNLAGKTSIRELMALIKCCSALLTNDSGPMHIAAALKVPLLALFGSTSEIKTGPYPTGRVIHKQVECSPCYKRTCPIDFRCMKSIGVDEVYQELMEILEESGQDGSI